MEHFEQLLSIVNNNESSETGGGHGQKGVEFQRHWAISNILTLVKEGKDDFLGLFEVIQDVAVYDSADSPKDLKIYQIKKKDRNEWGWKDLTGLYMIPKNGAPKKQPYEDVKDSTIGKLYASVNAIGGISASGFFVSNAGCNLSLEGGANAATSVSCSLNDLESNYKNALVEGLKHTAGFNSASLNLDKIIIRKTNLPVDDPRTYLVGEVHEFLKSRSPRHANQAGSLVDALLVKVAPLGAKTDSCSSFEELKIRHGFSAHDFGAALSSLEEVPDLLQHLNSWLSQLQSEGVGVFDITSIRMAASELYRNQLLDQVDSEVKDLEISCEEIISSSADPSILRPFFEDVYSQLEIKFPNVKRPVVYAVIALKAIKLCAGQI